MRRYLGRRYSCEGGEVHVLKVRWRLLARLYSVDDALWRNVDIQNSKIVLKMMANKRPATVNHEANLEISTLEWDQMMF
jgi:hypothetical protein